MDKIVKHGTCNIAYSATGEGQVLVFLHGFCERRTMWNDLAKGLAANYRIITIDLPGFGDSDLLPEISIGKIAESVNIVLETEKITAAHFIGHSMGGYVSLAFAEQFPSKLLSLTLFHSHPFADSAEKKNTRARALQFVEKNGTRIYLQQMIPTLFGQKFKKNNREFIQQLVDDAMEIPQDALVATGYAMLNRKDRAFVLEKMACPVLFIVGDEDEAIPFEIGLAQLSLPSIGKAHIQRGIGHMGMYEAFEDSLQVITEFISKFS